VGISLGDVADWIGEVKEDAVAEVDMSGESMVVDPAGDRTAGGEGALI
jgi:hypothetical protein